jgi:hypothetical protein
MKRADAKLIVIPLEFKIACTIYKLDIQEVLQIFINHVTLYDAICPFYNEGFSEATRPINIYIRSKRRKVKESKALLHCNDLAVDCIKGIVELAKKKTGQCQVKRKKSLFYVDSLHQIMKRTYVPSDTTYLDENTPLQLTKDFSVLCELHDRYPKEYLEHFMNMVSLADFHARMGLNMPQTNLLMVLFMKIANGFDRDSSEILQLTDMELDFYERMEELRLEIYNIRDLAERTAILKEFYLSHYQQINH